MLCNIENNYFSNVFKCPITEFNVFGLSRQKYPSNTRSVHSIQLKGKIKFRKKWDSDCSTTLYVFCQWETLMS